MKDHDDPSGSIRRLMTFDGTDGPAPPVDDLAKRRWINRILEAADAPIDDDLPKVPARPKPQRLWARFALAGGAIALCLAWYALTVTEYPAQNSPFPGRGDSRVALVSGDVSLNGDATSVHRETVAGDRVSTGRGSALLQLAAGVLVYLAANSELVLEAPNVAPPRVRLTRGRLVSSVERHENGALAFTVATELGQVRVRGTVFGVSAEGDEVEVVVLRGRVEVEGPDHPVRVVSGGYGHELGESAARKLTQKELAALELQSEPLALFEPRHRSTLALESEPPSALVSIDGVSMGRTPLSLSLEPGTRRFTLSLPGYRSVTQVVAPRAGEQIGRNVRLEVLDAKPEAAKGREPSAVRATDEKASSAGPSVRTRGRSPAAAPRLDEPDRLLGVARARRGAQDWAGLARAYQQLVERFPQSSQAGVALTGLGEVHLVHLSNPAAALDAFERYLAGFPTGVLAQEAAFGRIRALRALSRLEDERAAIDAFLLRFPGAVQSNGLRRRAQELGAAQ